MKSAINKFCEEIGVDYCYLQWGGAPTKYWVIGVYGSCWINEMWQIVFLEVFLKSVW